MNIQTTRICKECKENVVLDEYNFVYYKKSYIHFDCFVSMLVNKKRKPISVDEAKRFAIELRDSKECREVANFAIYKNRLYKWLQKKYEQGVMPSFVFTKLEDVFKGKYKGMNRPVPPEDLLDMWKRKWHYLNDLYAYNLNKGKDMDMTGRISYDLAVILAKVNSYYEWKEKLESDKQVIVNMQKEKQIDYNKILPAKKNKEKEIDFIIADEEE